jgi:hypothetical protein
LLAERGFYHSAGVLATIGKGVEVIVRLNTGNLPLYTASRRPFDLLGAVGGLPEAGQCGEWEVHVRAGTSVGRLRLCGIRKSEYGIQRWRWRRRWRTGTRGPSIWLNRAASAYPKCPCSSRGSAVKSA